MTTNIAVVAECLKWEANEYKRRYDEIQNTKERELKEANDNYKPGSKMLIERTEQIKNACDSSITKLRIETADRALGDIELLRQQEALRVQTIDEPLLAKIRAIADLPITSLELQAFAAKIGAKGNFWSNKMLLDICEKNGCDPTEIGLESTFDTKMSILSQLESQLNKILKYYGTNDPIERTNTKYLYLNDEIIERAKKLYNGEIGKLNDSQKADKAYIHIKAQVTDITKGISIANALRNTKSGTRNYLLCRLAEDNTISNMAAEFSGHYDEIINFKNGKAAEFRNAEKALQNIRKIKDKTMIENTVAEMEENSFFGDMFENEKKTNETLREILYLEPTMNSNTVE